LRREYRVSLLSLAGTKEGLDLAKLVCKPLAYTAAPLDSSAEISTFGRAATDVAVAPEKSFWNGLGGLFQSYELPVPKDTAKLEDGKLSAFKICAGDAESYANANSFLVDEVGKAVDEGAARALDFTAISGIIEVVGPAVTEALHQIDQQRRAAALRKFFSDEAKVKHLKDHVGSLKAFFVTMDKYRRMRAMEVVAEQRAALPAQWAAKELAKGGSNAPLQPLIAASTRYDVTYSAQLNPAFAALERSITDLEDIAKGNNEAALIRSAFAASTATLQALEGLRQLSTDNVKREKLQQLIDKLLGKKPKEKRDDDDAPAAAPQERQSSPAPSPPAPAPAAPAPQGGTTTPGV
jgi:hypothetical protein